MKKIFNKFLIGFLFLLGIILIPTFKVDAAITLTVRVDGSPVDKTVDQNSDVEISWISTGAASCAETKGRGGTGTTGRFLVKGIQATETFTVNCTRVDPSITQSGYTRICATVTGRQGGPYTCTSYTNTILQQFLIGDSVLPGDVFSVTVYSHSVNVTAVAGDTSSSIRSKLENAVNATTEAQWNEYGVAPASGTEGFKPTTRRVAENELGLVLDNKHGFASQVIPTSN